MAVCKFADHLRSRGYPPCKRCHLGVCIHWMVPLPIPYAWGVYACKHCDYVYAIIDFGQPNPYVQTLGGNKYQARNGNSVVAVGGAS